MNGRRYLKWAGWSAATLIGLFALLFIAGWLYVDSLELEREPKANIHATANDLAFMKHRVTETRGRILTVVTSTHQRAGSKRKLGYELTELSRPYWWFVANGYQVDIASPLGGEPTMVRDDGLTDADYAFLNDAQVKQKLSQTIPLSAVQPERYAAVYFVGGKGTMFDFPNNPDIQRIIRDIYPRGVVAAVCHGPAAFVGITLDNGEPLLRGRQITSFSNEEELFLIKNAAEFFPFLLQDKLVAEGAFFQQGPMYLNNLVVDGKLITGQNPWSTWAVAEAVIEALGHQPIARTTTPEEVSVQLLQTFRSEGLNAAIQQKSVSPQSDKMLILMHAVVAGMQWRLQEAYQLQQLARQ